MANNNSLILFLSLFAGHVVGQNMSQEDYAREIELNTAIHRQGPLKMELVRNLPEEQKQILRRYHRRGLAREDDFRTNQQTHRLELAMLGDAEARNKFVADWLRVREGWPLSKGIGDDLLRLESPEVIAQIGEILFLDEPMYAGSDVEYPVPQYTTLCIIVRTLKHAPEFSPEVKEWAKKVASVGNHLRAPFVPVRQWYRENEESLKRGAFAAVRPGPPVLEEELITVKIVVEPPTEPPPSRWPPPEPRLPIPPYELPPLFSGGESAALAAGGLAVFGGLFYLWKRRT